MATILKISDDENNAFEFHRDGDHFVVKAIGSSGSTPVIIEMHMDIEELKNVSDFLSKELKVMF